MSQGFEIRFYKRLKYSRIAYLSIHSVNGTDTRSHMDIKVQTSIYAHAHSHVYRYSMYTATVVYKCTCTCIYRYKDHVYRGKKKLAQHCFEPIILFHSFLVWDDFVLSSLSFPFNEWSILFTKWTMSRGATLLEMLQSLSSTSNNNSGVYNNLSSWVSFEITFCFLESNILTKSSHE